LDRFAQPPPAPEPQAAGVRVVPVGARVERLDTMLLKGPEGKIAKIARRQDLADRILSGQPA
jgi:hypothetical protein